MKIFFDLDGTLIDSKQRLYTLFQALVPSSNLSFEDYWLLKQNKISHQEILQSQFLFQPYQIKRFEDDWMIGIESDEYLKMDAVFPFTAEIVRKLSQNNELYVVTSRQYEGKACTQVDNLIGKKYFKNILVTKQKYDKRDLIGKEMPIAGQDWIVGDTGKDIQVGKALGLRTVAVLSGFLNKEQLSRYNPDFIFDDLSTANCFVNLI